MKNSKVKIIHGVNKWDGPNGVLYFHDLEMENGDRGTIGKKKENAYTVGQELNYTLEPDKRNEGKFKIVEEKKEFQGKGGSGYKQENPQVKFIGFAISYAKDMYVSAPVPMKEVIDNAEIMLDWMNKKYEEHMKKQPIQQTTAPASTEQPVSHSADMISEKQVTYIMSLWTDLKLENSEELRKGYIKHKYNVESTKDLTKEQASEFISDIKIKQSKITLEDEHGSKEDPSDDLPF